MATVVDVVVDVGDDVVVVAAVVVLIVVVVGTDNSCVCSMVLGTVISTTKIANVRI